MQSRRRTLNSSLAIVSASVILASTALVACGDDPDTVPTTRGFDTSRVVAIRSISCTNRMLRGAAIRLSDNAYLTAAHNVRDARTIDIDDPARGRESISPSLVASDPRVDLALVMVDRDTTRPVIDIDDWSEGDADHIAAVVTSTSTRSVPIGPDVIVRATRPDGSQRQWLGTSILSTVVSGESGSALVQDGAPIGLVVQAVMRSEAGFAVSTPAVREFVAKVTRVQPVPETECPDPLTSDHETGTIRLVGSTCS